MPSTIKTLEQMAYDMVRSSSFTKIHGRPTWSNYENFKKEASDRGGTDKIIKNNLLILLLFQ